MTKTRQELETIFREAGCDDFKWIEPQQIIVAQWVRMKCLYGCDEYGQNATCPPNAPAVAACQAFVQEYDTAVIFHFAAALPELEERERWLKEINARIARLERQVFLADYPKAFALPAAGCRLCSECQSTLDACKHPLTARPTAEALAIDVYGTARRAGYPIHVLTDLSQEMNRYAFLLVE